MGRICLSVSRLLDGRPGAGDGSLPLAIDRSSVSRRLRQRGDGHKITATEIQASGLHEWMINQTE